jgi:hypothetical protein
MWVSSSLLLAALGVAMAFETSPTVCAGNISGIHMQISRTEFSHAYSDIFHMSDGSIVIDDGSTRDEKHMDAAFRHMETLMTAVGARKINTTSGHAVEVCGEDMCRILMLAVLGNFVSSPSDPKYASQSSVETMATVVVDYTGSLVVVHSFATMRTYFLESLLFISIIAIARLSLVKHIVYSQPSTK